MQLPEGLIAIPEGLFAGCNALSEIEIPDGVTAIGSIAFNNCDALAWLVLPESVQTLGDEVFDDCDALSVVIPNSVTAIGDTQGGYTVYCYAGSFADQALSDSGCQIVYLDASTFAQLGGTLALDADSLTLIPGETHQLEPAIAPDFLRYVPVTWTSGAPELASVDADGLITALANGEATITAAIGETTAEVNVHVSTPLTGISFAQSEYWLEAGQSVAPALVLEPADGYETLTWSVSDELIASVDSDGVATVDEPADITLTVVAERGLSAQCTLHAVYPLRQILLDTESIKLTVGDTHALVATAVASDDSVYTGKLVTFETSDAAVAQVDPITGEITAAGRGRADIVVSNADGSVTATCAVVVRSVFVPMDTADFVLPAALTEIDVEAFTGLPMQVVACPEGLIAIGARAFAGCTGLRQIYIPQGVESIEDDAFDGCSAALKIYGYAGSEAERIADLNGFDFMEITD